MTNQGEPFSKNGLVSEIRKITRMNFGEPFDFGECDRIVHWFTRRWFPRKLFALYILRDNLEYVCLKYIIMLVSQKRVNYHRGEYYVIDTGAVLTRKDVEAECGLECGKTSAIDIPTNLMTQER